MKNEYVIPIAGAIFSLFLSVLAIHFWVARWYANFMQMSFIMAYAALVSFCILLHIWRIAMILRDRDVVTSIISRLIKYKKNFK